MRLGEIGFRHFSHNKQNGQLTCSSVQAEHFQWCTPLFFMDLSVQIDLTLVVQFISLLIFCVWSFINLMRFYVVKIWTSHGNYTGLTTAYCNTSPALLQHNTCHIRAAGTARVRPRIVAELDWLPPLAFKHPTWQAAPLTLKPFSACNPLPHVLPQPSSSWCYRAYHL